MCDDQNLPRQGRKYAGRTTKERTFQRRSAVVDAALNLFGTAGYAATSVDKICAECSLTKRYFYEIFNDREDCLAALYQELVEGMTVASLRTIGQGRHDLDATIRNGLGAFITYLTDDPRRARVVLVEVVGVSPAMETKRHGVLQDFANIITSIWEDQRDDISVREAVTQTEQLTAITLVGGVNHLLVSWLMNGCSQSPDDLTDICAALFAAAREHLVQTSLK